MLQGTFIDARSFEAGRSIDAAASPVADLGDDAYVVRVDGAAPATLYVREGTRAFALWLTAPGDGTAEGTLTSLARQVLAS